MKRVLQKCMLLVGLLLVPAWGQMIPLRPPQSQQPTTTEPESGEDQTAGETNLMQDPPAETEITAIPSNQTNPAVELATLPPIVDYDIQVRLEPETKQLTGQVRLIYTNHAPDIISDLRFHTYFNAFKNNLSTYALGSLFSRGTAVENRGYVHVKRTEVDGADLSETMAYFQGPNSAPGDQTVLRIPLQAPLMPGESVTVVLNFEAKIPQATDRTGYAGNFFFLAQWFPKIGVWESRGTRGATVSGWNCHPFHSNTEFFANFGNYRVAITVPETYEVGASGVLQGEKVIGEEKTFTFAQENIHDFAAVAAEELVRHERAFHPETAVSESEYQETMARLGINREQVALKPVTMIFLHPPDQTPNVDRHFAALEAGLKYFGLWFGAYPYPTITMVNPPVRAIGGMEYPTLITLGYMPRRPKDSYGLEGLILHEFAHQYFFGLLASNEFEEAFMDEGFTTYVSDKLTDMVYGGQAYFVKRFGYYWALSDMADIRRYSATETYWFSQRYQTFEEPIAMPGWAYYSISNYGRNSYSKAALALEQLERELGSDLMAKVLRQYTDRYFYQHPSLADFQVVAEEISQRDLGWFFDRVFRQTGRVDYEALPIKTYDIRLNDGYLDSPEGPVLQDSEATAENRQRQEVTVINRGTLVYPVTIALHFEDGQVLTERWNGEGRWARYYYDDTAKITAVVVDPDGIVVLDSNPTNNSYVVNPNPQWEKSLGHKIILGMQHLLQSLAMGF